MSWSVATYVAVHSAVLDQIDLDGPSGYLEIRDSSNVLLGTVPLTYPAGTVSPGTGRLTITFTATALEAVASGTADYAILKSASGTIVNSDIPCKAGSGPESGYCVLPSVTITEGAPIEGTSFTIG